MTENVSAGMQASNSSTSRDRSEEGQSSETPNWTMSYERLSGFLQS